MASLKDSQRTYDITKLYDEPLPSPDQNSSPWLNRMFDWNALDAGWSNNDSSGDAINDVNDLGR